MFPLHKERGTGIAGNVATTLTTKDSQSLRLVYGQINLTTDATVADRRVVLSAKDEDGNIMIDLHSGATVPASQTTQHHEFMQGIYRETSFIGNALQVPIPYDFIIPANYSISIAVENGQAGDSYNYSFMMAIEETTPGQAVI